MAIAAVCSERPHKPHTQKSPLTCAVPCAFVSIELAAPLPNIATETAIYDASSGTSLRGVNEGPAPPPPRIHDRAAIHKI
jgi:hypothetical protein